jgi:hypothetical protein
MRRRKPAEGRGIRRFALHARDRLKGPTNLTPEAQAASSRVLTLLIDVQVSGATQFHCDLQETGGHCIGEALDRKKHLTPSAPRTSTEITETARGRQAPQISPLFSVPSAFRFQC